MVQLVLFFLWSSENEKVGAGEQEIIAIVEGERIDFELRFLAPFRSTDPTYYDHNKY